RLLFSASSRVVTEWDMKSNLSSGSVDFNPVMPAKTEYPSFINSPDGRYIAASWEIKTASKADSSTAHFVSVFDIEKKETVFSELAGYDDRSSIEFSADSSLALVKKPSVRSETRVDL